MKFLTYTLALKTKYKSILDNQTQRVLALINKDNSGEYNFADNAEEIKFTDGTYPLSGRFIEKHDEIILLGHSQAGISGVYSFPTDMITIKSNKTSNTEINNEND